MLLVTYKYSSIGRFASADTIVPDPASPQSYNRYAYTLNNPLKYTDPSGHFTEEAIQNHIWDICGISWTCFDTTLANWQSDNGFWNMLRAAQAGDYIFGENCILRCEGFEATFLGKGDTMLTGIRFSQLSCNNKPCTNPQWKTRTGFKLSHIQTGKRIERYGTENNLYWGGAVLFQPGGGIRNVILNLAHTTFTTPNLFGETLRSSRGVDYTGGALAAGVCAYSGVGIVFIPACEMVGEEIMSNVVEHSFRTYPSDTEVLAVSTGFAFGGNFNHSDFGPMADSITVTAWGYRSFVTTIGHDKPNGQQQSHIIRLKA